MAVHGKDHGGMSRHRTSGTSPNSHHFSGKRAGKRRKRKSKGLSHKQRRTTRQPHVNKYAR